MRAKFIDSLSSHLDVTTQELNASYPECLHSEVVREIVETNIDGVFGISPEHDIAGLVPKYLLVWSDFTLLLHVCLQTIPIPLLQL